MMKKSLCVLCVLGFTSSVFADTKLDTKIIQGASYDSSIANKSSNIIVISSKDIEKKGFKNLKEALSSVPGVSIVNGNTIDMRGFGSKANKRVKVIVDGVNTNSVETNHNYADLDRISIEDVESIEIVPGGGNILYGSNASAGIVNIVTKSSIGKSFGGAYITRGSFRHGSFGASMGQALNDKLYASVLFDVLEQDGYQYADRLEVATGRFGLRYTPDDYQYLFLNVFADKKTSRDSASLTNEQMQKNRRDGGQNCFRGKCTLAENGGYNEKNKVDISLKYQNQFNDNVKFVFNPYYTKSKGGFDYQRRAGVVNVELDYGLSSTILGYEFEDGRQDYSYVERISQAHSVYALESLTLNDVFSLDIGARYKKDNISLKIKQGMNSRTKTYKNIESSNQSENAFGVNVVANVKFADNHKVYFKIENGFETPDMYQLFNKRPDETNPNLPFYYKNNIEKEKYTTYELGLKSALDNYFVNLVLFYTDTKNEIFVTGNAHSLYMDWYNLPKTQRYGAEVFFEQNLFDNALELSQGFSYIHAISKADSGFIDTGSKKDEKIPGVSPFKMNLYVGYNPIDVFGIRASYNYFSKTKWILEKDLERIAKLEKATKTYNDKKAYGVLDVGFDYKPIKNISLNFDVKNVLGEKYNMVCDGIKCRPAPKQVYYFSVRYKY